MNISFEAELQAIIGHSIPETRESIERLIAVLQSAGVTSFEKLLSLVQDYKREPDLRAQAIWLLAHIQDPHTVPALLSALTDIHPTVRREAALRVGLLGKTGDPRAVTPLIHALQHDPEMQVREAAAHTLRWFEAPEVVASLLRTLQDVQEAPNVRSEAAESLGELRAHHALAALLAALHDPSPLVRWECVYALGELGDARALPELERVATADNGTVPRPGSAVPWSLQGRGQGGNRPHQGVN